MFAHQWSSAPMNGSAAVFVPGQQWIMQEQKPEPPAIYNGSGNTEEDADLPAVVRVKKSSKGCAVVQLRDMALIERCVLQRVAVVDGICVEMRRHAKRTVVEGEEPKVGIFVAWGTRVERRVTVSEEGLEMYFNSLAGQPNPEGLLAKPPFVESDMYFTLKSDGGALLNADVQIDSASEEKILGSAYCKRSLIKDLWVAKGRLDELWNRPPPPLARSLMTRVARSQLFPHSGEGGQEHENRAGDKLAELSRAVGLLDGVPKNSAFLDLCGGPGAWSQHLLGHTDLALRGFGFTLKAGIGEVADWQAEAKDEWYEDLYEHPDWTALWGKDGTGDLLKPGNLEHAAIMLAKEPVFLCVADGGFSDKAIPANQLELYFYRLFLGELLMAASCLRPGGKFVCKLYTTFSTSSAALLYLTTRLFDSVSVVKPISSRVTGPERYLAAGGFREGDQTRTIRAALSQSHKLGNGASPLTTPLLMPLVSAQCLLKDLAFTLTMQSMVTGLCERQALALNAVVDRADFLEEMAMSSATSLECCMPDPSREARRKERDEPRKVCHFFLRGQCTYGDQCKKSHEGRPHVGANKFNESRSQKGKGKGRSSLVACGGA